ncbi:MAG: hypothetical protein SPJ13_01490, partial [Bacteroidales bacterium]|nr:hypothetical protein [Bacteroidales bacterium]
MPTPIQKGHYNDANDEENLLQGAVNGNDVGDGENNTVSSLAPSIVDAGNKAGNTGNVSTPTYDGYDDIISIMQDAQ